jgi:membrane protein DedA with SNARE-associated domain
MLESIVNWVSSLSAGWYYLALFVSAFFENIFPPLPGDTVAVFAAYLAGRNQGNFLGVFISTDLGSILGFMTYYLIGRLIHPEYFERKSFRFLPAAQIRKAGNWFRRYGYWIILFNRFLSGARSVISIVSGMSRLPWMRVLIVATIGCSIWNVLLIWAGYVLGTNWRMIQQILEHYSHVLLVLAVAAVVIWFLRKRLVHSGKKL